jgi:triphosphatase
MIARPWRAPLLRETGMTEIELKMQVPVHAQRAVDAAVGRGRAQRTRLRAVYYDTADRRLSAAGIALRVRQEGRRHVQTVKAAGEGLLERLEHDVVLRATARGEQRAPTVDPDLHAGTTVGTVLATALTPRAGETEVPLIPVYRTDIRRLHRTVRAPGGVVELAFDVGVILAGDQRLPVSELEIELVRGRPEAVVEVARRWAARHGLWLDLRSKAERGERLARGMHVVPAVKAGTVALDADAGVDAAARAVLAVCLLQVVRNASEISTGDFQPEHVHQMRVGLRRMRSALQLFEAWTSTLDPEWISGVADLFRQLGVQRDRDVLEAGVLASLRAAGAPMTDPRSAAQAAPESACGDPTRIARSQAFTDLMLQLQCYVLAPAQPSSCDPEALRTLLNGRLERWHRQVRRDARRFATLSEAARHRLRRRVKRLRYVVEFVATLYRDRRVRRYLARLVPLQEKLGAYNDLCVASALFRGATETDPRAWFAVGWLDATRTGLVTCITPELEALRRLRPFWD